MTQLEGFPFLSHDETSSARWLAGVLRASRAAVVWHTSRLRHSLSRMMHAGPNELALPTEQHAECAICFEDLCEQPVIVFVKKRSLRRRFFGRPHRRSCMHYFHESCAMQLNPKLCPLCRTPWFRCKRMPSFDDDPHGWFNCADVNGTGRLTRDQTQEALAASFSVSLAQLESCIEENWEDWESSSSGLIDKASFFAPGSSSCVVMPEAGE